MPQDQAKPEAKQPADGQEQRSADDRAQDVRLAECGAYVVA
ncbi:MAG TPA: hypothetical protein VIJ82_30415 [Streptosporangiaceae bacterium]